MTIGRIMMDTEEHLRLLAHGRKEANWKEWGPYLSDRAWGTVREDYSPEGEPWEYFPHDHARSRAYRWNEDGIGGISDRNQYLCFAFSFWNGEDEILKERFFGLTGNEGNHGEDVKEYYYYLDNTPTHSYMKMLYKYPQKAFPYFKLKDENKRRGRNEPEYELIDTGIFDQDEYFDIFIEYAKRGQEDILIKLTLHNRSSKLRSCSVLPTLWFRNTWDWGYLNGPMGDVQEKPHLRSYPSGNDFSTVLGSHTALGNYYLYALNTKESLFTENVTNTSLLYGASSPPRYSKDAFHRYLVKGEKEAINPLQEGTKAAFHYTLSVPSGESASIYLRLSREKLENPFKHAELTFQERKKEADLFYETVYSENTSAEEKLIQRQAFAGLLWNKQLYYFDAEQWLKGDLPPQPTPSIKRREGRNKNWEHLVNFDILSMPDKWEYPWYASWDLAFHAVTLVLIDPDFAKRQLILMTREWYMHPNGQLPAYEWEFSDVNPPVLAWAAWRVYKIDAKQNQKPDLEFLKGLFNKLLLNFTWWVNIKDEEGKNVFQGGFLGLDNISIFDRSKPLPAGGHIDQSDGTAWMGFYCVIMMKIALELSKSDPVYQDTATKFFEHFLRIAGAMRNCGGKGVDLWHEEDGFYYDVLHMPNDSIQHLKVRSLVGLLPLLAVETLEPLAIKETPIFERRVEWFISKKPNIASSISSVFEQGVGHRRLMSLMNKERLTRVLKRLFDEGEFLSEYGIRSLSKYHDKHPYSLFIDGMDYSINYQPAESQSGLFGGNSNWRGPIWLPLNLLIIETLQKYHHYYGDSLKAEFPTGSGRYLNLKDISKDLSKRLINIFKKDEKGERPVFGGQKLFKENPHWQDLILFHEYFDGDKGTGLGASHQTGWTALIAKLIQQTGAL